MIPRVFTFAAVALLALAQPLWAAPTDVQVGALRTPLNRGGAALREGPGMAAKVLGNVPHGTRLHVEAIEGVWVRTTTKIADGTSKTGWLRASETVEPYALTGEGRVGVGTGPRPGAIEVSAAGRGFSPQIEEQMAVGDAQLRAALEVLTSRVENVKPTPEETSAFSKQGRLGRPGRDR